MLIIHELQSPRDVGKGGSPERIVKGTQGLIPIILGCPTTLYPNVSFTVVCRFRLELHREYVVKVSFIDVFGTGCGNSLWIYLRRISGGFSKRCLERLVTMVLARSLFPAPVDSR